jgi:hypothetical protein
MINQNDKLASLLSRLIGINSSAVKKKLTLESSPAQGVGRLAVIEINF